MKEKTRKLFPKILSKISCRAFEYTGYVLCAVSIISLFGNIDRLIDIPSHFRVHYFAALLLFSIIFLIKKKWKHGLLYFAFAVFNMMFFINLYFPAAKPDGINEQDKLRVVSFNLNRKNKNKKEISKFLREQNPDIILMTEVNQQMQKHFTETFSSEYPYIEKAQKSTTNVILFMSRLKCENLEVVEFDNHPTAIKADIEKDGKKFTAIGIHTKTPCSKLGYLRQRIFFNSLTDYVNSAKNPLVIFGDFNDTTWSYKFREFLKETNLHDSRKGFGLQLSYNAKYFPMFRIPIDHCFFTNGFYALSRHKENQSYGSDHFPIVIDLALI